MEAQKKLFSETKFYPIFFMIVITIICVGILATFYHMTYKRVEDYQFAQIKKQVLETFDLPIETVSEDFQKYITMHTRDNITFYEAKRENNVIGYCFPIQGSGLWGTIRALVALDRDMSRIIGFTIVEQNETPGLGARIMESWFLDQFKKKPLLVNNEVIKFTLIPEEEKSNQTEIQQITGATSSSRAVVNILYNNLVEITQEF
jgi:Na+-transporting NADH:ubiquinone oxidoreductase subunit C